MDDDIILQKLRASGAPASLCKQLLTIWCRGFREQNENLGSIVFFKGDDPSRTITLGALFFKGGDLAQLR